jgi:hypothetical protein
MVPFFVSSSSSKAVDHTDIFSTLQIAGEVVRDGGQRTRVLVILSDMLQSSRGIEMDGLRHMPPKDWLRNQESTNQIPRFDRTCVLIVGADPTSSGSATIREFWFEYFKTAGADLSPDNYRATPPADDIPFCK